MCPSGAGDAATSTLLIRVMSNFGIAWLSYYGIGKYMSLSLPLREASAITHP